MHASLWVVIQVAGYSLVKSKKFLLVQASEVWGLFFIQKQMETTEGKYIMTSWEETNSQILYIKNILFIFDSTNNHHTTAL